MPSKIVLFLALLFLAACAGEEHAKETPRANKFSNNVALLEVLQAKNDQDGKALRAFLKHEQPDVREQAALAFGSMADTLDRQPLRTALQDRVPSVRRMVAFALGQLGLKADVAPLLKRLNKENDPDVCIALLHAAGKCATKEKVAKLNAFAPTNKADSIGLMWATYSIALSKIIDSTAVSRAVDYLSEPNAWLRDIPAFALARTEVEWLHPYTEKLVAALKAETVPEIRMALCLTLRGIEDERAFNVLHKTAVLDEDPRVRINAIRALGSSAHFEKAKSEFPAMLRDNDPLVRVVVSQQLQKGVDSKQVDKLLSKAEAEPSWRVKAGILSAVLRFAEENETKKMVRIRAKDIFEDKTGRYEQAAMLGVLGNDIHSLEYLRDATFAATDPAISTAGLEAIISVHREIDSPPEFDFVATYLEALNSKDITPIGLTARAIQELELEEVRITVQLLKGVQADLSLPREVEAWIEMQKTINWMEGVDAEVRAPNSNTTVDLEHIEHIPKDQKVRLQTAKGEIIIEVFVEDAPTSVSRFLKSVQAGFYNGKTFHRVVPNFVAQGGCPRGDGWGSPDWNLRSEFTPRHYTTGSVGLASAGRDTESCQFFITHSPTPHLDGRYTLFGQVVAGMDVAQQLGVGDVIDRAVLVP